MISMIFSSIRVINLINLVVNLTKLTNSILLTKNITLTFIDSNSQLPVKLIAYCMSASLFIDVSILSPNPVTISSGFSVISQLYEQCYIVHQILLTNKIFLCQ